MGLWKTDRYSKKTDLQVFHVQANNETTCINLFKFFGSVMLINIIGEVIEVTNTTNMTDVYYDIYDGTNIKTLTGTSAIFSGLCEGSFFAKMKDIIEDLVVHIADQNRVTEVKADEIGQPFLVTAKEGVDNYLRLCFATNTVLDFRFRLLIQYIAINGGYLLVQ